LGKNGLLGITDAGVGIEQVKALPFYVETKKKKKKRSPGEGVRF